MKALKISLVVAVVVAIAFFVIWSLIPHKLPISPPPPENQFTKRIEQEIDSLGKLLDSKFCRDAYDNVMFLISDYCKPHPPQYPYGRLGTTQMQNDQWKENFTKKLYSVYAGKFISRAFYVFSGSV